MSWHYATVESWPDERWTVADCAQHHGRPACYVIFESLYGGDVASSAESAWISRGEKGSWFRYEDREGRWTSSSWGSVSNPFFQVWKQGGGAYTTNDSGELVEADEDQEDLIGTWADEAAVATPAGVFSDCRRFTSEWAVNASDASWERWSEVLCPGVGRVSRQVEDTDETLSQAGFELLAHSSDF